jgi:hypothetical protein
MRNSSKVLQWCAEQRLRSNVLKFVYCEEGSAYLRQQQRIASGEEAFKRTDIV